MALTYRQISPDSRTLSLRLYWLLYSWLLLTGSIVTGQTTTITGRVTDTETSGGIKQANLMALTGPGGQLLSFAVTESTGNYSLSVTSTKDSFWLEVTHLNYEKQARWINSRPQAVTWTLSPRVHELPTLEVKQEAVTRRGDTLIFDAAQLREAGDETVEQLLARIPGISISAEGLIRYQDLRISKFYIEGLDLLEGRYALATRNLNINVVRDVEILERHQPIRALDSLVQPPNAAINLRLKTGIAVTGKGKIGLGTSPTLYDTEGILFGFTKKQQFNLLGSANNTGKSSGELFQNFYHEVPLAQTLVRPTLANRPLLIPSTFYLDNQAVAGGFNFLKKLDEQVQLKVNGFLIADRVGLRGSRQLMLFDTSSAIRFDEQFIGRQQPFTANSRVIYEINKSRFFLKSSVQAEWRTNHTRANNQFNATTSAENFGQHDLDVTGNFTTILRRGAKAYRFDGSLDRYVREALLTLSPLSVSVPDFPESNLATAVQHARHDVTRLDVNTKLNFRYRGLRAATKVGMEGEKVKLETDITDNSGGGEESLGPLFQNGTRQQRLAPYAHQEFRLERGHDEWRLKLPLSLDFFSYTDALRETHLRQNIFVTLPSLAYSRRLPREWLLSVKYRFNYDYEREAALYEGYLLRRNRFFARSAPTVNRRRKHLITTSLGGSNRRNTLNINGQLSASTTTSDLLPAASFSSTGETSSLEVRRNNRQRYVWSSRLSSSAIKNAHIEIATGYTLAVYPLLINGKEIRRSSTSFSVKPKLVYSFPNAILTVRPELTRIVNQVIGPPIWRDQLHLAYFQRLPGKWGDFRIAYDRVRTTTTNRSVQNNLIYLRYERKLWRDEVAFSLELNNVLGERDYLMLTQSPYSESLAVFQLRGRQLLMAVKKSF